MARHKRTGLIDLILFAIFWLSAGLGLWPPLFAAVATALFALMWIEKLVEYRLVLNYERREAMAPDAAEGQKWKPGERALLIYMPVSSIFLFGVLISLVWIGAYLGFAPSWLAIAATSFLTLVGSAAMVIFWLIIRRGLRERAEQSGEEGFEGAS